MLKIQLIPPTLKSMALNTISLELWKQPDVVSELRHLYDEGSWSKTKNWSKIRESVVEKLSHLSLPELLKEKAKEAVDTIGLRVTWWFEKIIIPLPANNISSYIRSIILNSDGGIDRKKTAASILKAVPNLDRCHRYRLACFHCLEDDARSLWKTLPVKERNNLLGVKSGLTREEHIRRYTREDANDDNDIVVYWSCLISNKFSFLYGIMESRRRRSVNIHDYFIQDSIYRNDIVAFKYFWEKLSDEEKGKNIVEYSLVLSHCIHYRIIIRNNIFGNQVGDFMEICKVMGSQMDEVQLKEMVLQDPYGALNFWCCFEYCHQGLVSLHSLWDFISPTHYREFFMKFVLIRMNHTDKYELFVRNDRRLFRELWDNTPKNMKRRFFKHDSDIELVLNSLKLTADVENLQLIFDEATVEERKIILRSLSRERFVSVLEEYCFHGSKSEEEVDEYLENIHSALNEKRVKGDIWPLLNNLKK